MDAERSGWFSARRCHTLKTPAIRAATVLALTLCSLSATAMSLGALVTDSHLGERLSVSVPLKQANGWREDQIRISLSGEASQWIRELEAQLQPTAGGYRIHIYSAVPISEPYLSLTVTARWPAGSVQRDYQVLLDPAPSRH